MLDNRRGDCEGLVGMCVPEVLYSTHTVAAPLNVKLSSTRIRKPAVQGTPVGKITRLRLRDTGKTSQPEGWVKLGQGPINWQPFHISFQAPTAPAPWSTPALTTDYICTAIGLSDRAIRQMAKCRSRRERARASTYTRDATLDHKPTWRGASSPFLGFAYLCSPASWLGAHARGHCES